MSAGLCVLDHNKVKIRLRKETSLTFAKTKISSKQFCGAQLFTCGLR